MNALYRWMFRHQKLAIVVFSVFLCGTYTALMWFFHAPVWLIVVLDLFLIFLTYCAVSTAAMKLLKPAYDILLNQCDPYPYLKETQEILAKTKSDAQKQIFLIDHCTALSYIGEYQIAYDILSSVNIDKYASILPPVKIIYYHNLASLCTELNDFEAANLWHKKSEQMYADLTNPKQKSQLDHTMQSGRAEDLFRKNDHNQALQILENKKSENTLESINDALLAAKIYIAQNDTESAKIKLQFVIVNGNKTHSVTEAQKLLEQL